MVGFGVGEAVSLQQLVLYASVIGWKLVNLHDVLVLISEGGCQVLFLLRFLYYLTVFELLLDEVVQHPMHIALDLIIVQKSSRFLLLFKILHGVLDEVF